MGDGGQLRKWRLVQGSNLNALLHFEAELERLRSKRNNPSRDSLTPSPLLVRNIRHPLRRSRNLRMTNNGKIVISFHPKSRYALIHADMRNGNKTYHRGEMLFIYLAMGNGRQWRGGGRGGDGRLDVNWRQALLQWCHLSCRHLRSIGFEVPARNRTASKKYFYH